jgi:hypothetical protein
VSPSWMIPSLLMEVIQDSVGPPTNEIMHMLAALGVYIQMSPWPPPFMMMRRQGCAATLKLTLSRG